MGGLGGGGTYLRVPRPLTNGHYALQRPLRGDIAQVLPIDARRKEKKNTTLVNRGTLKPDPDSPRRVCEELGGPGWMRREPTQQSYKMHDNMIYHSDEAVQRRVGQTGCGQKTQQANRGAAHAVFTLIGRLGCLRVLTLRKHSYV